MLLVTLLSLLPAGWSINFEHQEKRNLYQVTIATPIIAWIGIATSSFLVTPNYLSEPEDSPAVRHLVELVKHNIAIVKRKVKNAEVNNLKN